MQYEHELVVKTLRQVLESNPKMSCQSIEETIDRFSNELTKLPKLSQKMKLDWSNQDKKILGND